MPKDDRKHLVDVISYCCLSIPKSKRFSNLSEKDLQELWKESVTLVSQNLRQRKSVIFPTLGAFIVKIVKTGSAIGKETDICVPFFSASSVIERISGYEHARNSKNNSGNHAAETLNLSQVANSSGLSRDNVDLGIKDILHSLFRILKKGTSVVLTFYDIGQLLFEHGTVKMKYSSKFLKDLYDGFSPEGNSICSKNTASSPTNKTKIEKKEEKESQSTQLPYLEAKKTGEKKKVSSAEIKMSSKDILKGQSVNSPSNSAVQPTAVNVAWIEDRKVAEAAEKKDLLSSINSDIPLHILFASKKHHHQHSDTRLWSDGLCPICRQRDSLVIDARDQNSKKEKELDKTLLSLSLKIEQDSEDKNAKREEAKHRIALENAAYNRKKMVEYERSKPTYSFPHGNLFEKRPSPPDFHTLNKVHQEQLLKQISTRRMEKEKQHSLKELEDKIESQKFLQEYKKAQMESHLEKLRRNRVMQEALTHQIIEKNQRMREAVPIPFQNMFTRSETPITSMQREKAKQLYKEQLEMVRSHQEMERKRKELEKLSSIERMNKGKEELAKDIRAVKLEMYQNRKNLEAYWKDQMELKKKAEFATA